MQTFEQQQLQQQVSSSCLILSRTFSYFQSLVSIAGLIFVEIVLLELKTIQSTVPNELIDLFILVIFIFILVFIYQMLYHEQIILTNSEIILKRYLLFVPISFLSKVYPKDELKLSLIPQDLSKSSFLLLFLVYIQVNPHLNWLVLVRGEKKIYLVGFLKPEEIIIYVKNVIDAGVEYDESLEEFLKKLFNNNAEK